jgi:hypothetical protein
MIHYFQSTTLNMLYKYDSDSKQLFIKWLDSKTVGWTPHTDKCEPYEIYNSLTVRELTENQMILLLM